MEDEEQKNKEEYEARLRHRLELLKKKFETGDIQINPGLQVVDSLKAVRYASDGTIDLNTVDSLVRSLALAIEASHAREETKKSIPLLEIQQGYLAQIERVFGGLYTDMLREGATPFQVGSSVARDPEGIRIFHKAIPGMLEWVPGLWESAQDIVHAQAEDVDSLKSVFGGETFPQGSNIVSCTGIYVDTNILPDPLLRSQNVLKGSDQANAVRTFITNGLSLLQYQEAVIADVETPLAVILPDLLYLDEWTKDRVFSLADSDTIEHFTAMFGREFSDLKDIEDFLSKLPAADDVTKLLRDRSLLLFDVDDSGPLEEGINNYIKKFLEPNGLPAHAGRAVMLSTLGRMRQANDLLYRSTRLRGSPLINAPTSWRYFNWKLGYGNTQTDPKNHLNLHMAKALQNAASGEMEWLGAVPVKALIEMRKQGALPELRSILSAGVKELLETRPDNFFRTSDQVVDNIQNAFDVHRKKIAILTGKKWRFAGIELGSCVVKGAVQIASACGVPVVSLVGAALDQAVDVPKIKDIPKRITAIREESKSIRSSAVGMLFDLSRKK